MRPKFTLHFACDFQQSRHPFGAKGVGDHTGGNYGHDNLIANDLFAIMLSCLKCVDHVLLKLRVIQEKVHGILNTFRSDRHTDIVVPTCKNKKWGFTSSSKSRLYHMK